MLDPIKVTVLMPGVKENGSLERWGIPAAIVVKFLDTRGIINEKSGDYDILFLFSMGITKGKWGTLITELFEFKRLYGRGGTPCEIFPDLVEKWPEHYKGLALRELADRMHAFKKEHRMCELLQEAFAILPEPAVTYAKAYKKLVRNEVEQVPVCEAGGRIVAPVIVPYPPGIPDPCAGRTNRPQDGPLLQYLTVLQEFDNAFPGFEHDTHGIECENGVYRMYCINEEGNGTRPKTKKKY